MKTLKTTLTTTLLALGMTVGGSAFAINDTCRNFDIRVVNAAGTPPIKVTKIEYRNYDYSPRVVYRTAVNANRKINPGQNRTWTRNLKEVDNEPTHLVVSYREKRAYQAGYHPVRTIRTPNFVCQDNQRRTIRIN